MRNFRGSSARFINSQCSFATIMFMLGLIGIHDTQCSSEIESDVDNHLNAETNFLCLCNHDEYLEVHQLYFNSQLVES